LGREVFKRFDAKEEYNVFGTYHSNPVEAENTLSIDLTYYTNVQSLINVTEPDIIINCAAQTDADYCEENPRESYRINVDFPAMIADAAYLLDIHLIHISTPAVFDGEKGFYTEEDPANPINVYGQQKLEAERIVKSVPRHTILRADFFGYGSGLADFVYRNLQSGNKIQGYSDIIFSPISTSQYARMIEKIIRNSVTGIYHSGGRIHLSKYEFALFFAEQSKFDSSLIEKGESDFSVPRPKNTTLDSSKLYSELSLEPFELVEAP
jgi:dTDP-4-dehydrorhamnose reductase